MSRSNLPQSDTDRIAVAATAVAIAAIVWVILAVFPSPRDLSAMTAHAAMARHIDEGNRTSSHDGAAAIATHSGIAKAAPVRSVATY